MALTVGDITVLQTPTPAVGRPGDNYQGFKRETVVLPEGHQKTPTSRPLPVATIFERDFSITVRDGTTLRADIFRPDNDTPVPAIIAWSPYGKGGSGMFNLSFMPGRGGVPESQVSGYEKFEAPDPAEWVARGYAVVNVDARGVFDSEGDIRFMGSAEGRDGHDAIEFVARLPWCSGAVALAGNSWLAMAQYGIAALHPPHLKCIAPLEGQSDTFREQICRGGVPAPQFPAAVTHAFSGRGMTEDIVGMFEKYPLYNEYWDDKRANFHEIRVPAYILGSYSTMLHTEGSFRCYEELSAPKWLTIHATQEWHDLYTTERVQDLARFFDFYLKGIENGWEDTPPLRLSLLGFNQPNMTNVTFSNWPPSATAYKRLHLSDSGNLTEDTPASESTTSYQSDAPAMQIDADSEEIHFTYTFPNRSHLLGHPRAIIHASCPDHDDMDIFLQLRKADASGKILSSSNIPLEAMGMKSADEVPAVNITKYLGPTGIIRASRREIDPDISTPYYPRLSLRKEEKVAPGEVVKLDIGMWPTGMIFEAGEKLVLKISGHPMVLAEFPPLQGSYRPANRGRHVIHFGGRRDSYVDVPFVEL